MFSNVSLDGAARLARRRAVRGDGEDAAAADRASAAGRGGVLLAALRATKGVRTEYDHLMLGLHDRAKADLAYQRDCAQETARFAPGTTWLCFSDQVMHAALSGQYMLEQTIHLPLAALYEPERAPLAILERLTGRALTPAR